MKKSFKKYEKAGLPGGPNELKRFTNGFIISERGQWDYPGQPTAVPTPNGRITTEGVEDDLLGIDNLGNTQYMTPNNDYQFEGDMVYEIPQAKKGGSGCPKGQILINGRCVYVDQPTYADSLALYNNAIAKINFYDKGKNKYKKEKYATTNFKDKKVREELINKLHAAKITTPDDAIKELNKEAKSNKYSKKNSKNRFYKVPGTNLYSFGDILFGEQDAAYHPGSPPILLHKNIRPQGSVSYSRFYDTPNRMWSSTWQDLTDIPYYDPIAIKPGTILTDDEIKKRVPLYGTTGIPIDRLKKLGLNNSPSPCSNPITTVINNVPEKAPFGKKLVGTDEETLPVTGKKCEYVQTINPIYEDIKIEPIELQKSSVRIDNVPLQPLQMHDYTLPDSIEAPQYTLDPYTDDRLSLDVKLPQNKIAALFDRGVIDSKGHIALGKRNKTRLIPRIVQKATGYDPAYFEGYEDEEGNFVPGELDYGNATGSEIEFKGAASLRDLINQKKYEKEYEEYEKKLDEWLKEYEQQNKKQEEGGEFKKGGSKKPSKKYSRSLMAKNRLFAKNPLFKKKKSVKNKIFDPNSPYFQEGGFMDVELDDNDIDKYVKGGYVVEDISVPSLTKASYGHSVGNLIRKDDGGSVSNTQGLTADFSQRLTQMILDAKAQGIDLGVGSGYRSYEKQKRLWEQALKKYGSPEKARKWVAPPGGSFHNKGLAVDLNANGQFLGKDANSKATEWAHANAKKYGLHFRMGHEPWHIEPIEKTKSSSDKEDEHDHDDEAGIFGDQPKPTTQEEYEKMIQDKNLEFELKQKELAERERRLHDDDYSNWKPSKKEVVDPKQQILDQYSKIIAPSSQNVFEQYNANLQGQMKDGGFIMELTEKEIDRYRKGGFIIEELD
jgi:hypothetical protein